MGDFWADNPGIEGGGSFVGEAEKNELIDNGVTFPIVSLRTDDHPQYGERYVATVMLENDEGEEEERVITFPIATVDSRDRVLATMMKFLDDPANDPPLCKLSRVGRSILVRPADAPDDELEPDEKPAKAKAAPKAPAAKAPAKRVASKPAAKATSKRGKNRNK
jgi:hypothetical protein